MAGGRDGGPARGSDIVPRVLSGVVLAALAMVGAVLGGWVAAFLLGIVTAIVHLEWVRLTDRSPWPAAVFTAGLVMAIAIMPLGLVATGLTIVAVAIVAAALTIDAWRTVGVAYAAVLGIGLLLLRLSLDYGLAAVLVVFAVVWATDSGAFFAGRAFGGARLWPALSPNKTWAGAIGGLVAGSVGGLLVAGYLGLAPGAVLFTVIAALSVAAQAGDLFESWVKRRFGAKDSGRLVPGHGGFMDRVDGLVFATGLAVLTGWLHEGSDLARGLVVW